MQRFYNPTTQATQAYLRFPTYITMPEGGVKQKDALTMTDWANLGWYPYTVAQAPEGQQAVPPWSYIDNEDGTYTKEPSGWEPIPKPEPVPRYILLLLELQSRFTTSEKRAIDAATETSDAVYEIKAAVRSVVEIDLQASMIQEALVGLVAAGIITQERADEVLATVVE